jgi:osmotically inducible protein OsmC
MPTRTATARYQGLGKEGRGFVSTQSGVLQDQRYGFGTRFENEPGTNPEELLAAAHASCFTMALAFQLADAGHGAGDLDTSCRITLDKEGEGFTITKSELTLRATVDGVSAEEFDRLAQAAKQNCPLSKVIKAEITLDSALA